MAWIWWRYCMRRSGGLESRAACSMTILWGDKGQVAGGRQAVPGALGTCPPALSQQPRPSPGLPALPHFLLGPWAPGPPRALQAPTSSCCPRSCIPRAPRLHALVPAQSAGSLRPLQGPPGPAFWRKPPYSQGSDPSSRQAWRGPAASRANPRGHRDTVGAAGGPRRRCTPNMTQNPEWLTVSSGLPRPLGQGRPHTSGPARGPWPARLLPGQRNAGVGPAVGTEQGPSEGRRPWWAEPDRRHHCHRRSGPHS